MAAGGATDRGPAKLPTQRAVTDSRIERNGLKPGVRAPLFTLPDLDGRQESLVAYRGRRVLLVFSDPRCGPCNDVAPELVRLHAHNPALQIVMVSRGELTENRTKAQEHGFPFPVVLQDGWKLSKAYGIFATPVAFLIDEEGTIAKPVAIGADAIVAIASSSEAGDRRSRPRLPGVAAMTLSRWRAIKHVAAGFVTAVFMNPARAAAATCTSSASCSYGQICVGGQCQYAACTSSGTCPAGLACIGGLCQPCQSSANCPAGQSCVAGACQGSATCASSANCPAGQTCVQGLCQSACPPGYTLCNGTCVNFQTDAGACGACGNVCSGANSICFNGWCVPPCPPGMTRCASVPGPGTCVNVQTSATSCGACGIVCASGQTCVNGVCQGSGTCTSSANCPAGQVCVAGVCQPACPPGFTKCNGACVNLQTDSANCGACSNVCSGDSGCTNGACVSVVCPPGLTKCGKTCADLKKDTRNCGECGKRCPRGTYCIDGKCRAHRTGLREMWQKLRGILPGGTAV